MKIQWKRLIISILIPLGVGGVSALLTRNSMATFSELTNPPLSPPGWLFPVVWTILYALMGIAAYLIWQSDVPDEPKQAALIFYAVQLAVNFFWSILFFNLEAYLFSFIWLVLLWVLILVTLIQFYRINQPAGLLLIPYLIWVTFAGYLNLGIYLLN